MATDIYGNPIDSNGNYVDTNGNPVQPTFWDQLKQRSQAAQAAQRKFTPTGPIAQNYVQGYQGPQISSNMGPQASQGQTSDDSSLQALLQKLGGG